jgi:hypothetical protein
MSNSGPESGVFYHIQCFFVTFGVVFESVKEVVFLITFSNAMMVCIVWS